MKSKHLPSVFFLLFSLCLFLLLPKAVYAGNCTNPRPSSPCRRDSDCAPGNQCRFAGTFPDGNQCECWPIRMRLELPGGQVINLPTGYKFTDIGSIVSALLPYFYYLAGLILFGAIIVSGFQFLISAGDPKRTASAKGCLTNAIIGFAVIFISWWLIQIIETVFHLEILG